MKGLDVSWALMWIMTVALILPSRGAAAGPPPSLPPAAAPEPITGTAAVSAHGSEVRAHDPFTPYDVGPGTHWSHDDLTPAEQAVADRPRDAARVRRTEDSFARAAADRAHQASGAAAAHQLGIESLATIGVVP